MDKVNKDVESVISRVLNKNKKDLSGALIAPITKDYKFSSNGIYFICGGMSTGKSFQALKHILTTERLFNKPYYDQIIYTSTSGKLDKTVSAFSKEIKGKIVYKSDKDILSYLEKHLKQKQKYYAMYKYILSDFVELDDTMKHIIEKHKLYTIRGGKKEINIQKLFIYLINKMSKYGFQNYPSNTLLVLDDFAGNPLTTSPTSPLNRILTKTRHYNLTAIVIAQTWRFINLNLKRLCTDFIIFAGYSRDDFETMMKQTPTNVGVDTAWEEYSALPDKHSYMVINTTANSLEFVPNI